MHAVARRIALQALPYFEANSSIAVMEQNDMKKERHIKGMKVYYNPPALAYLPYHV